MDNSLNGRTHHYAKELQDLVGNLPETMKPLIDDLTKEVKANLERAQIVGQKAFKATERSVREHPVVTVLAVAAAVGLVWSIFASNKSGDHKSEHSY